MSENQMNRDHNILQELNEISPLVARIPKNTPYSTDEGFFEAARMELLSEIGIGNPYIVPKHYFDGIADSVLENLKKNQEVLVALNEGVAIINPYGVPENYFLDFEKKLKSKLPLQNQKGMLIRMNNWKIWSAAACLSGLLGLVLFFTIDDSTQTEEWKLSWKEARTILEKGTLEKEFNQIHTDELAFFLSEQGHDVDAAVMACLTEESELDEDWIYMENENEMETFLLETNPTLN